MTSSIFKTNNEIQNKYIATMILHSLGDIIGFKNGDWKFNYQKTPNLGSVFERYFEFIDLGGINGIKLEDWIASANTLYHMAVGKSLLEYVPKNKINDKFIEIIKDNFISVDNDLYEEEKKGIKRYAEVTTQKYITRFTETHDASTSNYDVNSGGNGPAGRSLCIGLLFYKESEIDELIETSIRISKLTHNSPSGFLAGFTSAYFVSLGIREINVSKWSSLLVEVLESDKIKKYIGQTNEESLDYLDYIRYWKKYNDDRFVEGKPIKFKSLRSIVYRTKFYWDSFVADSRFYYIGRGGLCAVLMAYDALLDCDGMWEKLIYYAVLPPCDSDYVGSIAGGLFGATYGYKTVPDHMFEHIEHKNILCELGEKIYKNIS